MWPFPKYSDEDLGPIVLPRVAWGERRDAESLETLHCHALQRATDTIKWYLTAKAPKRYYGAA